MRPGNRLGRMSERSAAIGLASTSSLFPPPNNSAACLEMNDQVTASTIPRAARPRLARRGAGWGAELDRRQHRLARCVAPLERRLGHIVDADNAHDLLHDVGLAVHVAAPGG